MMTQGTGPVDLAVLRALYSADHPALKQAALAITWLGDWRVLIPVTLAAGFWLLLLKHVRTALLLLTTAFLGRGLVELQKVGIGRMRPDQGEHLVAVKSLSFPSAHSANSMIFFLCIALLVPPKRYRPAAVIAALLLSFAVGLSRPMLGVHWPSDVLGGWSFGAAWVMAMLAIAERWPRQSGKAG